MGCGLEPRPAHNAAHRDPSAPLRRYRSPRRLPACLRPSTPAARVTHLPPRRDRPVPSSPTRLQAKLPVRIAERHRHSRRPLGAESWLALLRLLIARLRYLTGRCRRRQPRTLRPPRKAGGVPRADCPSAAETRGRHDAAAATGDGCRTARLRARALRL